MRSRVAKNRTFSVEELERRSVPSTLPLGMDVVGPGVIHASVQFHRSPPLLSASTISAGEIDPNWTAVTGAANYQLQGRLAGLCL